MSSGSFKSIRSAGAMRLVLGQHLSWSRRFTRDDILAFAKLTGDANPIHFGGDGAIVQGLLVASMFPALLASHIPGCIYIRQVLTFRRHVHPDQDITANIIVTKVRRSRRRITCLTTAVGPDGVEVVEGEAELNVPEL